MATIVNLITYSTKSAGGVGSAGQWLDSDANQVKSIVNLKADNSALTALEALVSTNTTDIATFNASLALKANTAVDSTNEAIRTRSNHIGGQDASTLTSGVLAIGRVPQQAVTQHQGALSISRTQITGLNGSIVDSSRTLTAGTGLTGGGDLTQNRTFALSVTGVSPGDYTSANITVDAYGRITSAANGEGTSDGNNIQGISYTQVITGDGSTTDFDLTHGQNVPNFMFSVFEVSTGEVVQVGVKVVNNNTARFSFSNAPANGKQYRIALMFTGAAQDIGSGVAAHTHSLSEVTDVTASAAEVNVLDGITATTTELNYTDGVTSAIQTQIDNKADTDHFHDGHVITFSSALTSLDNYKTAVETYANGFYTIRCNSASAMEITIPSNADEAFSIGTSINFFQAGAGQVEVSPEAGVTFEGKSNGSGEYKIREQYGAITIQKAGTDLWLVIGDLETA